MTASSLVDWSLLGQVVLIAVLAGVGVVVVFSLGLAAVSFARDQRRRRFTRNVGVAVAVVMTGALGWALWWGFELITNKS
jgi:threonine/homoserine/homoserine lactone efflux protein